MGFGESANLEPQRLWKRCEAASPRNACGITESMVDVPGGSAQVQALKENLPVSVFISGSYIIIINNVIQKTQVPWAGNSGVWRQPF